MALPTPPRINLLASCRPAILLTAFASLSASLMTVPPSHTTWILAAMLIPLAMITARLSWRGWFRLIRRLSLFFASLILFHGFFVPGHWIWEGLPSLTREGVLEGVQQSTRLILLATLAWILAASTTPWQLIAIANPPWLAKIFPQWSHALALLAMTLRTTGRLFIQASEVRNSLQLRQPLELFSRSDKVAWIGAADTLLWKMLWEVHLMEEALLVRGITRLPNVVARETSSLWWLDGLILFIAPGIWLIGI